MKYGIIVLFFLNFLFGNELVGVYQSQSFLFFKSAYVEFFKINGEYYAYGLENADHSPPKKDSKNPNPELRNRNDKGVVFLYDLIQTSPNNYKNGKAYNFYDGRTYYVRIHQRKNGDLDFYSSIDSTGYIGKTFLWKKLTEEEVKERGIKRPNFQEVLSTISQINH
ncbi:DUF2147 domain-containing protein [Helicobacter cappadocius]|uniref:DUF2147 domain-containing protein n=1 Tax=Helicobacter cappadocius TaxID=3063998 RepID=A0AA90PL55_9HELI|nr:MULTISPECIES: DUF2147 domain-containing protein [unclassified Helicobacter]MDO7253547.1 DUF2147 domain-containing protein [Helicobacter sp. faydin-H75]MDP2539475.1 DUF2147 domain-containing protein [Helicobacter sp. faydin-H76]